MTMIVEALAGLVFLPLGATLVIMLLPSRAGAVVGLVTVLALPVCLLPLTQAVWNETEVTLALAEFAPPLGIVWRLDGLALIMLWLTAIVAVAASIHALTSFPDDNHSSQRFWPLWLMLLAGINALFLSADLFNLYVTLELITLASVAMIGIGSKVLALKAAMRYLLLGLLASLLYLLAVALIYGQTGTLDLYLAGERLEADPLAATALVLMTLGLLFKAAIFPLHVWLPPAHGNAIGPVSAILSGLVVKVALYMLIRIWFWTAGDWDLSGAGTILGLFGAGAIIYGSLSALVQPRLKMVVAYSTVAQLGYIMLLFPLASIGAFRAASYHLLAHGLAKAAMFLAAANILKSLGTDRLTALTGLDRKLPVDLFAFTLAAVSLMGLPPSGGFLAKWLFLEAAWKQSAWGWLVLISLGSLLSAAYLFRVIALTCFHPRRNQEPAHWKRTPSSASLAALILALTAIAAGFTSAPIFELINDSLPPGGIWP
jgi:multicomponent Na+:H+ antiporter subunit D